MRIQIKGSSTLAALATLVSFGAACRNDLQDAKLNLERTLTPSWAALSLQVEHTAPYLNAVAVDKEASHGWAVGDGGVLLRLADDRWRIDQAASAVTSAHLRALVLSGDGASGWAVGSAGTVLRLTDEKWEADADAKALSVSRLVSVATSADMDDVWAVGDAATILHRQDGVWRVVPVSRERLRGSEVDTEGDTPPPSFLKIWISQDGLTGMILDSNGDVWTLEDEVWAIDDSLAERTVEPTVLALNKVGDWGVILGSEMIAEWNEETWLLDERRPREVPGTVVDVLTHSSEHRALAITANGSLLTLSDGRWRVASPPLEIGRVSGIATDETGQRGWAIGRPGIWRLDQSMKLVPVPSLALTDADLHGLWMNDAGTTGWAAGSNGTVLQYDGSWKRIEPPAPLAGALFTAVAASEQASVAYVVGENGALAINRGNRWRADSTVPRSLHLRSVTVVPRRSSAWVGGDDGVFLTHDGARWEFVRIGVRESILSIGLASDGSTGWAVGTNGLVARLDRQRWTVDEAARQVSLGFDLHAVAVGRDATRALAVGDGGTLMELRNGRWTRANPGFGPGAKAYDVWCDPDVEEAWVLGEGFIARLSRGAWQRSNRAPSGAVSPRKLDVDANGRPLWIVGLNGSIHALRPPVLPTVSLLKPSVANLPGLQGDFALEIANVGNSKLQLRDVVLATSDAAITIAPLSRTVDADSRVAVALNASRLATQFSGESARLEVRTEIPELIFPLSIAYRSEAFRVLARPYWHYALGAACLLGIFNIAAVLLAMRFPIVRRIVLNATGSKIIGLIVGRYVIIGPLIRYVKFIRLGMFRDYRANLYASSGLHRWVTEEYILPAVTADGIQREEGALSMDTEATFASIFDGVHRAGSNFLWLLHGPSGLGKTALLEQWTILALQRRLTPIFVSLGAAHDAGTELTLVLRQHGDLMLDHESAVDLIAEGGFIVFLDAFNEDRHPEATSAFVRKVVRRNIVVISSQVKPQWGSLFRLRTITLEPFGQRQLAAMLDTYTLLRVLDDEQLRYAARLPHTARLLARFVMRNKRLPRIALDLYADLRNVLGDEPAVQNLDRVGWNLFSQNVPMFDASDSFPRDFCEQAVSAGILTVRAEAPQRRYRFTHERLQRFFAARFMKSQPNRSLEQWRDDALGSLTAEHWFDVLEFWTEMHVPDGTSAYLDRLKGAAYFNPAIFRLRLFQQARRFARAGQIEISASFSEWAADFLTQHDQQQA